jgi:hypothetical protein
VSGTSDGAVGTAQLGAPGLRVTREPRQASEERERVSELVHRVLVAARDEPHGPRSEQIWAATDELGIPSEPTGEHCV